MASYHLRTAAQLLPNPGTQGSWEQRLVEGLRAFGTFDGATVGPLSGQGRWLKQLYEALDPRPAFGGAIWPQLLAGGGYPELIEAVRRTVESEQNPPEFSEAPSIGGSAIEGGTLEADPGVHNGTSEIYQWNRDAAPIDGATGLTYEVQAEDDTTELNFTCTAINAVGETPATTESVIAEAAAVDDPETPEPEVISITVQTGTTVAKKNRSAKKTGGMTKWGDASMYVDQALTGDFRVNYVVSDNSLALAAFLVADPGLNTSYTGATYGLGHTSAGQYQMLDNGAFGVDDGAFAAGDIFSVARIGAEIVRFHNDVEIGSRVAAPAGTLYFKTAFHDLGSEIADINPDAETGAEIVYNWVGNSGTASTAETIAANTLALFPITTPAGADGICRALFLRQATIQGGGVHIKPVIYSDNAGSVGSLLYTGDEHTTAVVTIPTDLVLTFPTDPALAASTAYWIGFITDGTFQATIVGSGLYRRFSDTYADGPTVTPGVGTADGDIFTIYISFGQTGIVAPVVGKVSEGGYISSTATVVRLPGAPADRIAGDLMLLHVTFRNTSSPPIFQTPGGYDEINEASLNDASNYRSIVWIRRIDGTEPIPQSGETGASVSRHSMNASLWRGYVASGVPYEAATTATATSAVPAGTDIVTLGPNRTVVNTYSYDGAQTFTHQSGAGWAEDYEYAVTVGMAMTSKEQASAGSVTKETAGLSASARWRSFTFALIKA